MAIILSPVDTVSATDFFQDLRDAEVATRLLPVFRQRIADGDKNKNILDGKEFTFSDSDIYMFISMAISDINSGVPLTSYNLWGIGDDMFVVDGAVVMALVNRGLLETKNAITFSDQGLSINTYDKGPNYQSWAGIIGNSYENKKRMYKQQEIYRNMFCSVHSPYSGSGRF